MDVLIAPDNVNCSYFDVRGCRGKRTLNDDERVSAACTFQLEDCRDRHVCVSSDDRKVIRHVYTYVYISKSDKSTAEKTVEMDRKKKKKGLILFVSQHRLIVRIMIFFTFRIVCHSLIHHIR